MEYQYTVLNDTAIERIHQTSQRVLSEAGMKVYDDELCATLSRRGLRVDHQQQLVRFPPEVVDAALQAVPGLFSVYDHRGNEIVLAKGNTLPAVYSNAIKVWDWESKRVRDSTSDDLINCVQLADAIPEIMVACAVCLPTDTPQPTQMVKAICILLQNSTKLNMAAPHDGAEAAFWSEAVTVADQDILTGTGPSLMFVVSPTNPLQIDPSTSEVLRHGVEHGIPLLISSCPVAGATSPITMAGTTVQTHAEFLGMLTITQLLREGMPIIYGGSAGPVDLRVGALSYGVSERNTMLCANIDIADYFGLPHFSAAGTVDSASPDFQAGQSKALTWLTRLMKGTILGLWFGSLLTGSTVAPEQIVLDADLYRAVLSMLKGMRLDEERLAYEAICRVGPGGNFLTDEHTLSWMRSDEYYASPILNHEGDQGQSMVDRAHQQVQTILESHRPSVTEKVQDDLRKLLEEHPEYLQA